MSGAESYLLGVSVGCWLLIGYYFVRKIHKEYEACPSILIALVAICIWPITLIIFFVTCNPFECNLVDKFLGRGKE